MGWQGVKSKAVFHSWFVGYSAGGSSDVDVVLHLLCTCAFACAVVPMRVVQGSTLIKCRVTHVHVYRSSLFQDVLLWMCRRDNMSHTWRDEL